MAENSKKFTWLAFALYLTLLPFSVSNEASDGYKCFPFSRAFEKRPNEEHNRLFGTKTTYLTARRNIRNQFTDLWPVDEKKCKPVYFYMLSRHTIRYPKESQITEFRQFLYPLRDAIVKNGLDPRYKELAAWKFQMNETDDNQVSHSGRLEAAKTAKIFYDYFPELLDVNKVHFEVGYTPKIRTKQTSDSFLDSLIREQIVGNFGHSKVDNIVDEIRNKKFHESQNDILMSHRVCKANLKDKLKDMKDPKEYDQLSGSDAFALMLNKFSQRNGLSYTLSLNSLLLVYQICIYEDAIFYKSPWCDLFTKSELEMIEYLLDIIEYHDAHAIKQYRRLACTVTNDLYRKVNSIITGDQLNSNATLYFSHENLLSKLLSYLGLFDNFPTYEHGPDKLCLPDKRQWRASNVLSFGTNFATVLYKCDNTERKLDSDRGENAYHNHSFKMLTLINEVPVAIRGCSSAFCPVEEFFNEFRSTLDNCDLNVICK